MSVNSKVVKKNGLSRLPGLCGRLRRRRVTVLVKTHISGLFSNEMLGWLLGRQRRFGVRNRLQLLFLIITLVPPLWLQTVNKEITWEMRSPEAENKESHLQTAGILSHSCLVENNNCLSVNSNSNSKSFIGMKVPKEQCCRSIRK